MYKKSLSFICAIILIICSFTSVVSINAAEIKEIKTASQLKSAFTSNDDATYILKGNIYLNNKNSGITADFSLDGNRESGYFITSNETGNGATFYQNEGVNSYFDNVVIKGNKKGDVGIWLSAGSMTFTDSSITDYNITDGQRAAIALAGSSVLNLNNSVVSSSNDYDICLNNNATLNINEGTQISKMRIKSQFAKLNFGADWSGSIALTFDSPVCRAIGNASDSADISSITITNDGYYLENCDGVIYLKSNNEREIHFDMAQRETLYKGSTGFLYGTSEINVPSVDLLYGLKPATMVQKTISGSQHPTGDVVRNSSSVLSAGAKDLQVYFQDYYLEWPYDAPIKNDTIDIDSYQKTVEAMLYQMICNEVDANYVNSIAGSDGKYYTVNSSVAEKYSYVLFNEPDQIWFGGNLEGLENAWKQIYNAVHNIDPNAKCVGPNYAGFSEYDYNAFLIFCRDNDCLPEIISWHELGDISLTDFYHHYDCVQDYIDEYYSASSYKPQLIVNEYARHYDIGSPGGLVKWLSMFEDKDISGCMAYWAMANSLNELAADQNSPSSSWWVYHWYAQMTGNQCPLTYPSFESTRLYGVASYDEDINMGYALFGGNEDIAGSEYVYLDNIDSTALCNENGDVNVKLYSVSFSGQQGANYAPDCIFDSAVSTQGNSLKISVCDTDEMDAFFAILTKPDNNSSAVSMSNITTPALSYEAEDAKLIGNATAYPKTDWYMFATSGRMDVGNICHNGDGVQFDVTVSEGGLYCASLYYSLQSPYVNPLTLETDSNGQNRGIGKTLPYGVYVDGVRQPDIYLESTVSWLYKNHCDVNLNLDEGEHTITFVHINGDESAKGNSQLTAAFDKLDLNRIDNPDTQYDFDIQLSEMTAFKEENGYRITAVASADGYYTISADSQVTVLKQSVDYAPDAKTFSTVSLYDIPAGNTLYLSKGANTLVIDTDSDTVRFAYQEELTDSCTTVISADDITLHGNNPQYKDNQYASSGKVISNIGIGQNPINNDTAERNYVYFKVNAQSEGIYNLAIRYSNDEPAPAMPKADGSIYIHPYNIDLVERYAQICVNSDDPETVYFRNTMSWDTFKTVSLQVKLKQGENIIRIYNDNSYQFSPLVNSTAPEIDTVSITALTYDSSAVELINKNNEQAHSYSQNIIPPSYEAQGYTIFTCTECGYSYIGNYTDALKPEPQPQPEQPVSDTTTSIQTQVSSVSISEENSTTIQNIVAPAVTTTAQQTTTTATKITASKPKATSIKKLTKGSKSFKITWKKISGINGYEIQYSTDKSFKKNKKSVLITKQKTTSSTVKKLKSKKKYYVRIRTYKLIKVNGKNVKKYSSWSKVKTVTTK